MEQWRMKVEYGELPMSLINETLNDRVPGHVELNLAVQHITSACKVDLKIPLYSGLAAHIFILNITRRKAIPLAGNVTGQAQFWASQYHQGGDQQNFLNRVFSLGVSVTLLCLFVYSTKTQ